MSREVFERSKELNGEAKKESVTLSNLDLDAQDAGAIGALCFDNRVSRKLDLSRNRLAATFRARRPKLGRLETRAVSLHWLAVPTPKKNWV